jgi:hypothetical protein
MKKFSRFISEAQDSLAVLQAKRLGLVSDGHAGWYDRKTGEFVAKTEGGKLKFYNQNQVIGRQDPPQDRSKANQSVSSLQSSSTPKTKSKPKIESLTIAFGRFNPPTVGHKVLMDAVAEVAGKDEYRIYPSRTNDKKKNPLDPDTKIAVMQKMFPEYAESIINDPNSKTIFDVLKQAYEEGFSTINIVVGSDRQSEFEKLANQYNGDLYEFSEINVLSAGDRDPDSDGVDGMSASKLRKAAAEKDFKTFKKGIPTTLNDKEVKELYNLIRTSMNLEEDYELWQIAPKYDWKNLREKYITNNIFRVGQLVENLNTGLIGKIIRRGTNYLICVTEDDMMFKPWIRDVSEVFEKEVPAKNLKRLVKKAVKRSDTNIDGFVDKEDKKTGPYGAFIPQLRNTPKNFKVNEWTDQSGVSADQREVGTDAFREYAMKMSDTTKIDNFNLKKFINKYKQRKK